MDRPGPRRRQDREAEQQRMQPGSNRPLQRGPLDRLPNIRWLYMDTDPAGVTSAQEGTPGVALTAQEILLTRLNTTDHYTKGVGLRVPISSWLNPLMLYRIPRTLLTGGVRALGRLALMDHYTTIVQRLRDELKAGA